MQLRLQPKRSSGLVKRSFIIKTIFFATIFILVIFLLDKIEMPAPNKLIELKISNDQLTTLK